MYLNKFLKDIFYLTLIIIIALLFSLLDQCAFIMIDVMHKLNLLISIIYLALALLCIESFGIKSVDLSRRIGLVYIVLSPFRFYQLSIRSYLSSQSIPSSYILRILSIVMLVEVILLIRCFKPSKKITNYTKEIYLSLFIFLTLYGGNQLILLLLDFINSSQYFSIFYSVIHIITLVLSIYLLKIIIKIKINFSQELYYNLLMFILFFVFHKFFIFNTIPSLNGPITFFRIILNLFYSYFLFKFIKLRIRTITIKDLTDQLIKRNHDEQLKNEFLSIISHEFKTPVNVIYSALQLQKINIEDGNLLGLHKCTRVIKQNCHRLMRLIGNLLDITTLEAGHLKSSFKSYNIVSIVENIYIELKDFTTKNNIIIHFHTDQKEIYVSTDYLLLERILLNILSNAVKYSKPEGNIFIHLKVEKNQLFISIKDDGIGIPADKLNLIFNRFSRIDNSLSRKQEGLGTGLYLVKALTELLHGSISISSTEQIGTEVTLNFTLSSPEYSTEELPPHLISDTVSLSDKINIEFSDIYL